MAIIHRITTDDTLTEDLRASLRERGVVWDRTVAGLFAAISAFGYTPGDRLGSVEVGIAQHGSGRIIAESVDGEIEVREL